MNWKNQLTKLFNTEYPLIQAPMLGVSTPEMVAAAAKVNVLGALPLGDLPAGKCTELIRSTRKLTDKPFAVNIFVNEIPEISDSLKKHYSDTKQYIEQLARRHDLDVTLPAIEEIRLTSYHDQIEAILSEGCRIVSFTFGNPDAESIRKLKQHDTILIGTCTSVEEAIALEKSGADALCVQGIEAGGHRGSFLGSAVPQISGISLLAQVYDTVSLPLIYAGGLYNGRTIRAASALGAQGFQIGSLLLGSRESMLQEFEKQRLRNIDEKDIVLTRSFTGRYARGIKNEFINNLENSSYILPYPYQNKLTAELRRMAKSIQNTDFMSLWLGQSINGFSGLSTSDILRQLIEETEKTK